MQAGNAPSPVQALDTRTGKAANATGRHASKFSASSADVSAMQVRTRKQRDSLNAQEDKENVKSVPKRKTAATKKSATSKAVTASKTVAAPKTPAVPVKKQLSAKAQGKQRAASESTEPEEVAPVQPPRGKKRARQDTTSEENSASDNKSQAKRPRMLETTTKEAKAAAKRFSARKDDEDLQGLSEAMARQFVRHVNVSDPERKADYDKIMANTIWQFRETGKSSDEKNRNSWTLRFYELAMKTGVGDGKVVAHEDDLDCPYGFYAPYEAAPHINRQLDGLERKRQEEEDRLAQRLKAYEEAVGKQMDRAFQTFEATGMNGVAIVDSRGEHRLNSNAIAETHTSPTQGVASDLQIPPVTPTRGGRFTSFVKSVSRPLTSLMPSFSRGTAPAQSQVALAAAVSPTARSLSDTTGSERTTAQIQQNGEQSGLLAPIRTFSSDGTENASPRPVFDRDDMESLPSLPATPTRNVLPSQATPTELDIRTPEMSTIDPLAITRIPLPNTTAMFNADPVTGMPASADHPSVKKSISDWIALEVKRKAHEEKERMRSEYQAKLQEATQKLRTNVGIKYERQVKQMEHQYAQQAEERIKAAIEETKAQYAQMKSDPVAAKKVKKTKKVRHPRIGSEQLPLTSDGMIPGPKKGGYGIDDEYLYAPLSDEDSVWSEECSTGDEDSLVLNTGKRILEGIDVPEFPKNKRRRVSFASPTMKEKLHQAAQVQATPRAGILKKTSKYGPTIENDKPVSSKPLGLHVPYGAAPGPTMTFKVPSPTSSDFDPEEDDQDPGSPPPIDLEDPNLTWDKLMASRNTPSKTPVSQAATDPVVQSTTSSSTGTTTEPAAASTTATVEPSKGPRLATSEAEKDTEALRRMKEKADFVREEKFRPRTPSKLREEKRVSSSPKTKSVADVMAMFPGDAGISRPFNPFVTV